jgi:hypothetical protein
MGNGVSNEEFERQGKLLGVKSVPGKPSQKFKPLSIKRMKEIQKQIIFEYPYLTNVFESILVTDNELPDCPIGTRPPHHHHATTHALRTTTHPWYQRLSVGGVCSVGQ